MLTWHKQGPAFTAPVKLEDGTAGNAVVLGAKDNPKAIALVTQQGGEQSSASFAEAVGQLPPSTLIEILCMQERAFGSHAFPKPEGLG